MTRADAAYSGSSRAGYTRAGVYIPIFENNVLPTLESTTTSGGAALAAIAGTATAGSTRAGVYLPVFDGHLLPTLESIDLGSTADSARWESALWESARWENTGGNTVFELLKQSLEI